MSAEFIVDGDNTTIRIERTAATTTIQNIIGDAAHYLWDKGFGDHGTEETPIAWDGLTNQDKLDIADTYFARVITDAANTYKSVAAQNAARESEAQSEYEL